jgi:hypothetical protein
VSRRLLPATVLLALAFALSGALVAQPPRHLPNAALGAVLAWRVELAVLVFVAAYGAIVAVRLAFYGQTLTRIGSGGIEIPDPHASAAIDREARIAAAELDVSLAEVTAAVEGLEGRLEAIEHALHLLLRSTQGDLP